jgi:hypothetical protein
MGRWASLGLDRPQPRVLLRDRGYDISDEDAKVDVARCLYSAQVDTRPRA